MLGGGGIVGSYEADVFLCFGSVGFGSGSIKMGALEVPGVVVLLMGGSR